MNTPMNINGLRQETNSEMFKEHSLVSNVMNADMSGILLIDDLANPKKVNRSDTNSVVESLPDSVQTKKVIEVITLKN